MLLKYVVVLYRNYIENENVFHLETIFLSPFNKYTKSVKYGYIIFDAEMPPYGSAN